MRINMPVTQRNYDFPGDELLVSSTNTKGEITHCNQAFVRVSGYSYEELIGQPHNIIRHPDMPPEAYKDMWRTIGRGEPWTGLVKNRRKNGDHYWVRANVTPIMENGRPRGYMSVRTKPAPQEAAAAEALYAQMRAEAASGRATVVLHAGAVLRTGWRGWGQRLAGLTLTQRMALMLLWMVLLALAPDMLGMQGAGGVGVRVALLLMAAGAVLWRFQVAVVQGINKASHFAADLSGCNLTSTVQDDYPQPLQGLIHRLQQTQVNLRAVVGDVRTEVRHFTEAAAEIAQGSHDLSGRTESQASSLEQTASSMEELASTVRQTADTALRVSHESEQSSRIASEGGQAVQELAVAMRQMEQSSAKINEIVGMIEGIAFQTNLLALNAAVEAARAGEQGRGFAVVAGEVRALAQRSAGAAKEISSLIQVTVQQIASGAHRMDHAGQTIGGVVDAVQRVSALVQQISAATKEQSIGIAQVNEAVTQLDTVTQQNAALVEESTASAQNLKSSAQSLGLSVDVFKMP
ncbi:PAS domain-containing protein [Acidovorax sp. DW039]|uniref:methyl-accepting chemotaxis protein n=1 Tax=Acidovorax sp. DW039 TaxID=3095606 RepID=UPI0030924B85|nr:PAS domain-containing protein [Acidovorax sp. DW039]